jgi:hypothetical protein
MSKRPDYQGLDGQGFEITREARVIGELPHELREQACAEAAIAIARQLSLPAPAKIKSGVSVFQSFGLTRPKAKVHAAARLLLTPGTDVSLDYCTTWKAA